MANQALAFNDVPLRQGECDPNNRLPQLQVRTLGENGAKTKNADVMNWRQFIATDAMLDGLQLRRNKVNDRSCYSVGFTALKTQHPCR